MIQTLLNSVVVGTAPDVVLCTMHFILDKQQRFYMHFSCRQCPFAKQSIAF